jgi:hypothetical protein
MSSQPTKFNLQARVVEYMMANANQPLSAETIMRAVGAERKLQIQNVIGYLRRSRPHDLGGHIQVLIAGNMYQWDTDGRHTPELKPSPAKRLFEELATTVDGTVLVQDEDGRPYRLVEI